MMAGEAASVSCRSSEECTCHGMRRGPRSGCRVHGAASVSCRSSEECTCHGMACTRVGG